MKLKLKFLLSASLVLFAGMGVRAEEPTAYDLIRSGDQFVGVQSKDQVVQIRSEKSIGSLVPNIWYIVYYDPDATFKSVEIKFGAGQKLDVSHPWRVLELAGDDHTPLDKSKLNVDSDRAIRIATSQPLLENLKISATQLWLEHGDNGPQWRVKLWALRPKNTQEDADIGIVILSATDGSIVKIDLHPNSAD
jgi:hypothetical protein